MHNFKRDILHILQFFVFYFCRRFSCRTQKSRLPQAQKKKRSNDFCCEIVGPLGPSGENRTHGLLNPIQARYQNCATPGYLFAFAAHSLISIPDFSRFVKRFFQISDAVFTFYCPGFCPPKGCAKERYFQKSRYTSSSSSSWMGVVSSGGAPNSTVAKASANTLSAPA